jgi:hypothetical protein
MMSFKVKWKQIPLVSNSEESGYPYARPAFKWITIFVVFFCLFYIFVSELHPDMVRDAKGNDVFADTPRALVDWKKKISLEIANEVADKNQKNDDWIKEIRYFEAHQEHPQKYINYIIEQRRAAGLPELVGYP